MWWKVLFPILAASAVAASDFLWHWSRSPLDLVPPAAIAGILAYAFAKNPFRFSVGLVGLILFYVTVFGVILSLNLWHWVNSVTASSVILIGTIYLMYSVTGDFFPGPYSPARSSVYPVGWWKNTWVYLLIGAAALIVIISDDISQWTNSGYALVIVAVGAGFVANNIARDISRAPFFHEFLRRLSSK